MIINIHFVNYDRFFVFSNVYRGILRTAQIALPIVFVVVVTKT